MLQKLVKKISKKFSKLKKREPKSLVGRELDTKLLRKIHGKKVPSWGQFRRIKHLLSSKEQKILSLSSLIFLVGIFWSGVVLVNNFRVDIPAVGGKYIEAVVGSPQLINPVFASINDVDLDISNLVYSGLLRYDENQQIQLDLAESYEISDDKKTYTFKLKEDVKWHDGQPFTAYDVVFTIDTILEPSVNSPLFVSFQGVDVKVIDEQNVRFTLKEPFTPFLSSLTVGIIPEHIWSQISPERVRLAQRNLQPVGTGPFVFKKLVQDESGYIFRYELVRYENYHRAPAFIKEFVFQFYNEYGGEAGAIQAIREQKVDGLNFVPSDLQHRVERKHINLHTLHLPQYNALFFNLGVDKMKSKNLRTALSYAINKDRILKEVLSGEAKTLNGPILPGFPGFDEEKNKSTYDVQEASELLDKSWSKVTAEDYRTLRKETLLKEWEDLQKTEEETVGEETGNISTTTPEIATEVLEAEKTRLRELAEQEIEIRLNEEISEVQSFYRKNSNDEFLTLKLVTADTEEFRQVANLLSAFWQDLGVMTNIKYVNSKDFNKEVLRPREYDILLYGVIVGNDPDQFPFWHSSQVAFPGLNLSGYVNRNADALLEQAQKEDNTEKLEEIYSKLQDIIIAEKPASFLFIPIYTYATTDKVQGVSAVRIARPADRFADVNTWFIKTKGQWNFKK
ncbi:MAG: peptide ABC transporter substrate-binding protein [Candidatus Magasanikbacteria bacterium]|nr:peptide ABC transporter substrate-binding protein [Candidatus Magasanikbacteria bacterium]